MKKLYSLSIAIIIAQLTHAKIWRVGPLKSFSTPSQVSTLVSSGDTVEIDAGVYNDDVAKWTANNLLLKGVGGMAHLKSNGNSYGGKAIWVIGGNNTRVEYIEFSLCTCTSHNGAGIRQEGRNLYVSHCYFHDNEDGILAGTVNPSTIIIEYSEFGYNGYGDGYTHNLYINNLDTLIFRYNYSHHAKVGHELKSRAHVNIILYNRFSDESTGTASRSIDMPNGGTAYLIGNIIEQGPQTQNANIIGYGLEGLTNPTANEVYAINNTLVNHRNGGSFFAFESGTTLYKGYNNIIAGSGSYVSGNFPTNVDTSSNLISTDIGTFGFVNDAQYDDHISINSISVLNSGTNPGSINGFSLSPTMEYRHSNDATTRCTNGVIDIGAYEFCNSTDIKPKFENHITIYPNPSSDLLTIQNWNNNNQSIQIFNLDSKLLYNNQNYKNDPIDVRNLCNGIYILRYVDKDNTYTKQFVVNH